MLASALAVGAGRLLATRSETRSLHYLGAGLFSIIGLVMLIRGPDLPSPSEPAASEPAQVRDDLGE